ncbi:MAG: InlB B-repeat-containing protein, partial [Actinomycetota bacterium]
TYLHISGDDFLRSVPIPAAAAAIIGFDAVKRDVFLGVCTYAPRVVAVSVDTGDLRVIPTPLGPVTMCGARYDPVLRALWMTNGYWAGDEVYDTDGAAVFAVSVDTGATVASTTVSCRPDGHTGQLWVGDGPIGVVDNGRAALECLNSNSASSQINFFRATDLSDGSVIRTSSSWFLLVGATRSEGFITVSDTGAMIHGAGDLVVPFSFSLEFGVTSLKRPFAMLGGTHAQVARRTGTQVVAVDRFGNHRAVDLVSRTARQVGNYDSAGTNTAFGAAVAEGQTVVQAQRGGNLSVVSETAGVEIDSIGRLMTWEMVDPGGLRPMGYGALSSPTTVLPFGPGDVVVLARVRLPDNSGVPTAEDLGTVFVHVRGPATPTISSRTANAVSFTGGAREGLAPGATSTWEYRIGASSYEVRDSLGSTRCSGSGTTCTSTGRFGSGATVTPVAAAGGTSAFGKGDAAASGITLPAAPRIFPWTTTQADQAAIWTNPLPATATGREIKCQGSTESITISGSTTGASRSTVPPGLLLCRARSTSAIGAGPWGPATLIQSESASDRASALTGGVGSLTLGGSGASASCRSGSSTLTATSGQTKTAASGAWRCVIIAADSTSTSRVVWSSTTPSAPSTPTVTRSGGSLQVGFQTAESDAVVASSTIRCGTLDPATATASPAVVTGASGLGPHSCTVETNHLNPADNTSSAGPASSAGATTTRSLEVGVDGSGSVASSPTGINCTSTCTSPVDADITVVLTATAASDWAFSAWEGAPCSGTTCTVVMSANKSVTARFSRVYSFELNQNGSGSVGSSGSVVYTNSNGERATTTVLSGTTVTLTATPASGWSVGSWNVGGCTGTTCTVTATSDLSVQVNFVLTPTTTQAPTTTAAPTTTQAPTTTTAPIVPATPTTTSPATTSPTTSRPASPTTAAPGTTAPLAQAPRTTVNTSAPVASPTVRTVRYTESLASTASRITATSAATRSGVTVPKGAKVTVAISSKYSRICRVSGSTIVRMNTRSTCVATVTILSKSTKKIVTVAIRRPA